MRTNPRNVCEDFKLQFPIFKSHRDFGADWRVSQGVYERLLGRAELAEIEASQPYNLSPAYPEQHPLYVLGKLDNLDKHRLVLVVEQAVRMTGAMVTAAGQTPFDSRKQPLQNGEYTMLLDRPKEPHGRVELNRPKPYLVFSDTDVCDNLSVFPLFREMACAVKDTIARFDQFF